MVTASQIRRNTVLLALCLVTLSGVLQLATAVATITLVLVTGIESILGLGPAIFLSAGALAALPAGDRESMINIAQIEGQMRASSIRRVAELAEKHPDEAVSVVRGWMAQEG